MKKGKNKSVIFNKNAVTLIIVTAVCLLLIIIGFCNVLNRYFDSKENSKGGLRPTFYADEMKQMNIIIPSNNESDEINSIDYKISLQNKSNVTSVCRYNLYYYWDEYSDNYYRNDNQSRITLTGSINGHTIFDNIELKNYDLGDLRTLLASYYIVNDGSEITNQSWHITSYFHNSSDQESLLNISYPGKIGVEEVVCSKAKYLKDQDYRDDGTYICLNSQDEFCSSDDLYEVIGKDDEGIKIVRTKAFGISSWNNDLLPRLEEAFLNSDGKYIKGMIIDHSWPIYDEDDLNANAEIIQSNEESAQNKIVSKVGLLSLKDYKSLKPLADYNKPFLLLSDSGLVISMDGTLLKTNATGYIYPVLYLDNNAVISKGNGTWGNPYFVN